MNQKYDKDNPLVTVLNEYKEYHDAESLSLDQFNEIYADVPCIFSKKIDGEITLVLFEDGQTSLISRAGRVRTDLPVTRQISELLQTAKVSRLVAVAELYLVDDGGKVITYPQAISTLRKPTGPADEQRIQVLVFDLLSVSGDEQIVEKSYEERMAVVKELFGKGTLVTPAFAQEGTQALATKLWKEVLESEGRIEGLVVTSGTPPGEARIKIKPSFNIDLAVVGVERSAKHPERMGALQLAFMNKDGLFLMDGKVGVGFSNEGRAEWMDWAESNLVKEDGNLLWVDPFGEPRVIEVLAEEVSFKEGEALKFNKGVNEWLYVKEELTGVLRNPRFIQVRPDKGLTHSDLRLSQAPNLPKESRWLRASTPVELPTELKASGFKDTTTALIRDWYPKIKSLLESKLGNFVGSIKEEVQPLATEEVETKRIHAKYSPEGQIFMNEKAEEPNYVVRNLLHEMFHANTHGLFASVFMNEGFVDYGCELLSRDPLFESLPNFAEDYVGNNAHREEIAQERPNDFNKLRWEGQVWSRENLPGNSLFTFIKEQKQPEELAREAFEMGEKIESINLGVPGVIIDKAPENRGGTGFDLDYVVKWDKPIDEDSETGAPILITEVHRTEIRKATLRPGTEQNIVIQSNQFYTAGLTKQDVYDYYSKVGPKLLPFVKGQDLYVINKTDGEVLRRHPGNDKKQAYYISNKTELEELNTGRMVEVHLVIGAQTKLAWVDLDPKKDFSWEQTKKVTDDLATRLGELENVEDVIVKYSGAKGFHILLKLGEAVDSNGCRDSLQEFLNEYIQVEGAINLTTGVTKDSNAMRLDVSTVKPTGSIRAPYSLSIKTGLVSLPLKKDQILSFEKEQAVISKITLTSSLQVSGHCGPCSLVKAEFLKILSDTNFKTPGTIPDDKLCELVKSVEELYLDSFIKIAKGILPLIKDDKLNTKLSQMLLSLEDINVHLHDGTMEVADKPEKKSNQLTPASANQYSESSKDVTTVTKWLAGGITPVLGQVKGVGPGWEGKFVIQRHQADKAGLHWDLRLEWPTYEGDFLKEYETKRKWPGTPEPKGETTPKTVLKSFAVRYFDDLNSGTKDKVLAVETEPHPMSYINFKGSIPEGEYGAGDMSILDSGTYSVLTYQPNKQLTFRLHGQKIKRVYSLVRTQDDKWLLVRPRE